MTLDPGGQASTDALFLTDALLLGARGDTRAACARLRPILERGPEGIFVVLSAFARYRVKDLPPKCGCGVYVFGMNDDDGAEIDADDLPPTIRFVTRFLSAWANDDRPTAVALLAGMQDHPAELAEAIRILFECAVETLKNEHRTI